MFNLKTVFVANHGLLSGTDIAPYSINQPSKIQMGRA
jgi:hypothetical protein